MNGNTDETVVTTTTGEAGKAALEEIAKKFADMTATEAELGFGDKFCDYRAPLAQVAIFKAAEEPEEDPTKTYKDENGEDKTAEELKAAAEEKHTRTPGKEEKMKKFYSELFEEEEAGDDVDEGTGTDNGEGTGTGNGEGSGNGEGTGNGEGSGNGEGDGAGGTDTTGQEGGN